MVDLIAEEFEIVELAFEVRLVGLETLEFLEQKFAVALRHREPALRIGNLRVELGEVAGEDADLFGQFILVRLELRELRVALGELFLLGFFQRGQGDLRRGEGGLGGLGFGLHLGEFGFGDRELGLGINEIRGSDGEVRDDVGEIERERFGFLDAVGQRGFEGVVDLALFIEGGANFVAVGLQLDPALVSLDLLLVANFIEKEERHPKANAQE